MNNPSIKPLPLWPALLYFAIPSIVAAIIVYAVMPWLDARGLPFFFNYVLIYASAPMLALMAASLIAYQREMWAGFHLFVPWNLVAILPGCLALSYVTQRLKNTWPAVVAHGLANGLLVLIVVVLGVAG